MLSSVPRRGLVPVRRGHGFGPTFSCCHLDFLKLDIDLREYIEKFGLNALAFLYMGMEELWFASNDIPIDVLSRLPLKTLLNVKCVSKQWHRLISERFFIRHQSERKEFKEPISGFFFQERFQWCDDDIRSISYIPVNTEVTKVQRSVFNFLPQSVVLLSVSNGLICCRSCFPSPQPVVYICNPLNKEWVTLPWPTVPKQSSLGLAFDPSRDITDESTNFKVVAVHQNESETEMEDSYFSYDVYSSKTKTWTKSKEICQCNHNLYKNKGIFIGGALYWLTDGDQILMFDVQNELCWLVSVPFPLGAFDSMPGVCIGESEGKLHCVLITELGIHVWALEDYLDLNWACRYSITLEEMEAENSEFLCNVQQRMASGIDTAPWMDPLAFKDGLLFMRVATKIYLYNFEPRKMEELCTLSMLGPNSMISPIVLPYSMSLVPLDRQ
ncbi:hypothetical protein RHSIM_Rhsim10G0188800 [Rhododendron simsii]|uniref:F-box domain-containing protein n=1 Tax=Rhododendron simsii TaxID=118357 RepID=A0A834LE11_RHOSS|nr:hypothetical protein RHSIM_Rhsim10G0188800 [Rhododendron simsii]